jgi:hypothetical protein
VLRNHRIEGGIEDALFALGMGQQFISQKAAKGTSENYLQKSGE